MCCTSYHILVPVLDVACRGLSYQIMLTGLRLLGSVATYKRIAAVGNCLE